MRTTALATLLVTLSACAMGEPLDPGAFLAPEPVHAADAGPDAATLATHPDTTIRAIDAGPYACRDACYADCPHTDEGAYYRCVWTCLERCTGYDL